MKVFLCLLTQLQEHFSRKSYTAPFKFPWGHLFTYNRLMMGHLIDEQLVGLVSGELNTNFTKIQILRGYPEWGC